VSYRNISSTKNHVSTISLFGIDGQGVARKALVSFSEHGRHLEKQDLITIGKMGEWGVAYLRLLTLSVEHSSAPSQNYQ
jgi:hypothetical protein